MRERERGFVYRKQHPTLGWDLLPVTSTRVCLAKAVGDISFSPSPTFQPLPLLALGSPNYCVHRALLASRVEWPSPCERPATWVILRASGSSHLLSQHIYSPACLCVHSSFFLDINTRISLISVFHRHFPLWFPQVSFMFAGSIR